MSRIHWLFTFRLWPINLDLRVAKLTLPSLPHRSSRGQAGQEGVLQPVVRPVPVLPSPNPIPTARASVPQRDLHPDRVLAGGPSGRTVPLRAVYPGRVDRIAVRGGLWTDDRGYV